MEKVHLYTSWIDDFSLAGRSGSACVMKIVCCRFAASHTLLSSGLHGTLILHEDCLSVKESNLTFDKLSIPEPSCFMAACPPLQHAEET